MFFAGLFGGGGRLVVLAEVTDGAKTEEVFGWVDILQVGEVDEMVDFGRILVDQNTTCPTVGAKLFWSKITEVIK